MPKFKVNDEIVHPDFTNSRRITAVGEERYLWVGGGGRELNSTFANFDEGRWTLKPREPKKDEVWVCKSSGNTYSVLVAADGFVVYRRVVFEGLYVQTVKAFVNDFKPAWF